MKFTEQHSIVTTIFLLRIFIIMILILNRSTLGRLPARPLIQAIPRPGAGVLTAASGESIPASFSCSAKWKAWLTHTAALYSLHPLLLPLLHLRQLADAKTSGTPLSPSP